ncbi:MAG: hypothetical protein EAX87_09785 [Candidatus Thorarchaeota archaeon]|nr:hypothetical protein [Candidatus Thorarchaeota archaeon]
MKNSVRIWTVTGTLVTLLAIAIGIICAFFQTDPEANLTVVLDILIVLQILGADLLAIAVLKQKQEINSVIAFILIVIGFVGFGASASFHNALVTAFFPRTIISALLGIDFVEIGMFGVFLSIFRGRIPVK